MPSVLEVRDLQVAYAAPDGRCWWALAGVDFTLQHGEILGVLGESGSGKSTLGAALLRVLPPNARIRSGSVRFESRDLLQLAPREMEKTRGARIALIFQEPSLAMHPAVRVGRQIEDVLAAHQWGKRSERKARVQELLAKLFFQDAARIAAAYPHQLSGGQKARILIAQAVCCGPALVVADEATASLDPETQQEMLRLFWQLKEELKLSLIWITHSPTSLVGFADRVAVLYAGRIVEMGAAEDVLAAPEHPYTQGLLRCLPPMPGQDVSGHKARLPVIAGEAPVTATQASCCAFEPRCEERVERCSKEQPQMAAFRNAREVSCFQRQS